MRHLVYLRVLVVAYLNLTLAVVFNTLAYVVFKAISIREHSLSWALLFGVGLAFGATNTFFFTSALRTVRLGVAYPIFSGTSIASVAVVSALVFKEQFTAVNLLGACLIALGIGILTQ